MIQKIKLIFMGVLMMGILGCETAPKNQQCSKNDPNAQLVCELRRDVEKLMKPGQ